MSERETPKPVIRVPPSTTVQDNTGAAMAVIVQTIDHSTGRAWVVQANGSWGSLSPVGLPFQAFAGYHTHLRANREALAIKVGNNTTPNWVLFRPMQGFTHVLAGSLDPAQPNPGIDPSASNATIPA